MNYFDSRAGERKRRGRSIEQADGMVSASNRFSKRLMIRRERRKAKQVPDCQPGYKHYNGYVS